MGSNHPERRCDRRPASADSRRQIGECLRNAFAVGDLGSFTSLLQAIGEDAAQAVRQ